MQIEKIIYRFSLLCYLITILNLSSAYVLHCYNYINYRPDYNGEATTPMSTPNEIPSVHGLTADENANTGLVYDENNDDGSESFPESGIYAYVM